MQQIIAKCGYRCDLCSCYETNLKTDADRQRVSDVLKKYYECELPPEAVKPCKGCHKMAAPPDPQCPVYPCADERGLANCGLCSDFPCEKVDSRIEIVERRLAENPDMPEEDFNLFVKPHLSRELLTKIHADASD